MRLPEPDKREDRAYARACAARGVAYAWAHHAALAVQAGIPPSAVDDIDAGREPAAYYKAFGAMATAMGAQIESSEVLQVERDFQKGRV